MKLCKDCKHFISVGMTRLICTNAKSVDAAITGIHCAECVTERSNMGNCGPDALFFDAIEE